MPRRLLALCTLALAATAAQAQTFPAKPVRFVVPFAPGGQSDIVARALGQKLTELWSQPVVVENRPGAATTIGTDLVAKAPADGYTLLLAPAPFVITQYAYPKLPYDGRRDFTPVTLVVANPVVLTVHPSVPASSLAELVAHAKARPGTMTFGSPGNGSLPHLALELFKIRTNVEIIHAPYKGGGPAVIDMVAGHIQGMFASPAEVGAHIAAGKLKPIAVTARTRIRDMPNVATLQEGGVTGFEVLAWFGVVMRAGTPNEIVRRVAADIARATEAPDVRQKLTAPGTDVVTGSPEDFAKFLDAEHDRWSLAVRTANIKVE
jgi:tripartite-type tricarboxylate transporter receptor subunit TctC